MPNINHNEPEIQPAEDLGFRSRPMPGAKGMLPGMAGIGIYLLLLSIFNAFAAIHGTFRSVGDKYTIIALCILLVVGVFGMLNLRRWGWAIVNAGCLLLAAKYFYGFHRTHFAPYIIQGLFAMVFFFYLSRPETRARLR